MSSPPDEPHLDQTCGDPEKEWFHMSVPRLTSHVERVRDGIVILRIGGEVDMATAESLTEQIRSLLAQGTSHVILDTTGITFMDSTGMHALVAGKRALHEEGAAIYLVPSDAVRRLFELVFPEPLFATWFDTVDEAIASIGSP